jgi:hypothetical protein
VTTPTKPSELRPIITFPRDAIVETAHVAAAIGVSRDVVGTMDLPCFYPGAYPRYLWGQVLDELARRAHPDAVPQATPTKRRRRRPER